MINETAPVSIRDTPSQLGSVDVSPPDLQQLACADPTNAAVQRHLSMVNGLPNCATAPAPRPVLDATTIATAFARLRVPAATMLIEPDGGNHLLYMPANLIAQAGPTTLSMTLLGQPVTIRATPASYTWTFTSPAAPTSSFTTTNSGSAYAPTNQVTVGQTFTVPGAYRVSLTTTYTGEYSLNAGTTWQPINGTTTAASPAQTITAHEARNKLTQ